MAGHPYTRRFAARQFTGAAGTDSVFTATDVWTWIIRDVVVSNQLNGAGEVSVFISGAGFQDLVHAMTLGVGETIHWDGRQELLPDEQILFTHPAGYYSILVTGYALTPPS